MVSTTATRIARIADVAGSVNQQLSLAKANRKESRLGFNDDSRDLGSLDAYLWSFIRSKPKQNRWDYAVVACLR